MDKGHISILILLDLSASFCRIDHNMLLTCLPYGSVAISALQVAPIISLQEDLKGTQRSHINPFFFKVYMKVQDPGVGTVACAGNGAIIGGWGQEHGQDQKRGTDQGRGQEQKRSQEQGNKTVTEPERDWVALLCPPHKCSSRPL